MRPRKGETIYSEEYPGTTENYNWSVRFDLTDGYLGIDQSESRMVKDRVLLSKHQIKSLLLWLASNEITL